MISSARVYYIPGNFFKNSNQVTYPCCISLSCTRFVGTSQRSWKNLKKKIQRCCLRSFPGNLVQFLSALNLVHYFDNLYTRSQNLRWPSTFSKKSYSDFFRNYIHNFFGKILSFSLGIYLGIIEAVI